MSDDKQMSPEEQLAALGLAQRSMQHASEFGARLLGAYAIILGLLFGALAALLQVYSPEANFIGFMVITALFVVGVVAISLAYARLYRSLPRGYSKKYLRGFILSLVLYAVAVALMAAGPMGWGMTVLIGLVVAAPLCLTGIAMVRK